MGPHFLDQLFSPRAVAVFGASPHADSVGGRVFTNLRESGFAGPLYAVNPKHDSIADADIFIAAAAVADYRPAEEQRQKIKKNAETMHIDLVRCPDILQSVAALESAPFTVGFAAETLIENAIRLFFVRLRHPLAVRERVTHLRDKNLDGKRDILVIQMWLRLGEALNQLCSGHRGSPQSHCGAGRVAHADDTIPSVAVQ